MGELDGKKGAWAFVMGGNGAISDAIAASALSSGAEIYTSKVSYPLANDNIQCMINFNPQTVVKVKTDSANRTKGVVLEGGREIEAKVVLSNATAHTTFLKLAPAVN